MIRVFIVTVALAGITCGGNVPRGEETTTNSEFDSVDDVTTLSESLLSTAEENTTTSTSIGYSPVSRKKRIVYGETVDEFDHRYIVSLRVDDSHVCSGTILTPRLILTAAHCIERKRGRRQITHVVVTVSRKNKRRYRVIDDKSHPRFRYNKKGQLFHDVGLLLLKTEIENARTVSLQSKPGKAAGKSQAQALGWGRTEDGVMSRRLRIVDVPLLPVSQCERHSRGEWVCIDSSEGDTCDGDSGGPLMYRGKQIGITSFGASSDDDEVPCTTGGPSVFARVSSYYDWIQQQIESFPDQSDDYDDHDD